MAGDLKPSDNVVFAAVVAAVLAGGGGWALRLFSVDLPWWVPAVPVVVAVLTVVVLKLVGYPPGGRGLALGLPLLTAVLAVVAVGVTTERPVAPVGVPVEVTDLPVADPTLPADVVTAVVFRDPDGGTALTVEFPAVRTLAGHWSFTGGIVTAPPFPGGVDAPPKEATWGDTITTRTDGDSGVTPTFDVELPLAPYLDRTTIPVTARMNLHYPVTDGTRFVEKDTTPERTVRLFVGSPADGRYREALDDWQRTRKLVTGQVVALSIVGGFGLLSTAGGVVVMVTARRTRVRS